MTYTCVHASSSEMGRPQNPFLLVLYLITQSPCRFLLLLFFIQWVSLPFPMIQLPILDFEVLLTLATPISLAIST